MDEVKTKLTAEYFIVNGDAGSQSPEAVEAAKERLAVAAAESRALLKGKYIAERVVEHGMALLPFSLFANCYLSRESRNKPVLVIGAVTLRWDEAKRDFTHLPAGRKRPDRYELPRAKEMLMRDAMKHGVIVPFTTYYETPGLQYPSHPDLQLSDIKSIITSYPQQLDAPDYKDLVEDVERRSSVQRTIRERWAKYRTKVIAPLLAKGQTFWIKEKGKDKEITWTQWHCNEKPEELSMPTQRGIGDTLALKRRAGYMVFHSDFPFHAIYLIKDALESILERYPIDEVLAEGLNPESIQQHSPNDETAAAIALMEMLELEITL